MIYGTNGESYGYFSRLTAGFVECAVIPAENMYVIGDNWQTDPMNPAVMWRAKTQAELDTEHDTEVQAQFDNTKLVKAVAIWVAGLHGISLQDARNQIKQIYKNL